MNNPMDMKIKYLSPVMAFLIVLLAAIVVFSSATEVFAQANNIAAVNVANKAAWEVQYALGQHATQIMDASCSNMSSWGFTAGIMYCVYSSIGNAVSAYTYGLQKALATYEFMAAVVAIAFFGIKLMQSHVKEPIKEGMTLGFRLLIGVFFFSNGYYIYVSLAGTHDVAGAVSSMIGWMTQYTIGSGVVSTPVPGASLFAFAKLIGSSCTPHAPPTTYYGIEVWQAFDCMLTQMFGATNDPKDFATSLLVIAAAALFSGTLGITVITLAMSAFFSALLIIFRALFLVLMAYITIGFLCILAPLIAPLLFFDSKMLTEKFKRWLGLLISTTLQPVFVIAFLSMAVTVDDMFIEGTKLPGCTPPHLLPNPIPDPIPPAPSSKGWGQDGSGVCSFTQLFGKTGSGSVGTSIAESFEMMIDQNSKLFDWNINGDTQGKNANTSPAVGNPYYDPGKDAEDRTEVDLHANQSVQSQGTIEVGGVATLKPYVPMKQLGLTLLAFIFANYIMLELLELIPEMASNMTISVGMNLYTQMQLPLESTIRGAMGGAADGAKDAMKGAGLVDGNIKSITQLPSAIAGAAKGFIRGGISGK